MRTTVDLPDDLFRKVKATAAIRGMKLKDFIADSLEKSVVSDLKKSKNRVSFPLIKSPLGTPTLTFEMIKKAELQILDEEAEHYAKFMRR